MALNECGCNDEDGKYRPVSALRQIYFLVYLFRKFPKITYLLHVRRWETLGSRTQIAQSIASATVATLSPVSPGSAARRRSARLSTDCWTAILQVNPILNHRVMIIPNAATSVHVSKPNPRLCASIAPQVKEFVMWLEILIIIPLMV